jgi:proline iminopeptidase
MRAKAATTRTTTTTTTTTTTAKLSMLCGALALLAGCLDPGDPGNLVPGTVADDPALPRIEVAGALLHAEAFGNPGAPAIVVLHGGPGADYRGLLPLRALADDGYRVVFWDQRGAGLSQRFDEGSYNLAAYLEDLRLVVEQTVAPGQPFVFIGHSWGAMYATWFINTYGDYGGRLRGAILSEPGGFNKRQLNAFIDRLIGSVAFTGEQLNDATWAGQFMSPSDHARADYLATLMALHSVPSEHLDPANPRPMWRMGAVVSEAMLALADHQGFDWTTHLGAFAHKVLFLRGDLNAAATLAHQQELAGNYPDADIVTIPNVGHEMVWERPAEYLAHTRDYLQAIGFVGGAK